MWIVIKGLLVIIIITVRMVVTPWRLVLLVTVGVPAYGKYPSIYFCKFDLFIIFCVTSVTLVLPITRQHAFIFVKLLSAVVLSRVSIFFILLFAAYSGSSSVAALRPA